MNRCSNCTRGVAHYKKPWFMDMKTFKNAVDSMVGFRGFQGVGITGGDPLLHPDFEEMCEYARSKIPTSDLGLWSCFPAGKEYLGPLISDTFGTVFLNDHSRADIVHHPFLVSIEEVRDKRDMWFFINDCWAQMSWSASINPFGAYFCELAAAMAMLFNDPETAWPVEPEWWIRTPKDYIAQMEKWCPKCGGALCGPDVAKGRYSNEIVDDVSPNMLERLKMIDSPKIARGEFVVHDLQMCQENRQKATYKDNNFRNNIAARYGLFLVINQKGFWTPFKKIVGGLT